MQSESANPCILVLNAGSSSVKFALYAVGERPVRRLAGAAEDLGRERGRFHIIDELGRSRADKNGPIATQEDAFDLILAAVEDSGASLAAVGHRIVHGGPDCVCPEMITPELEQELAKLVPLAPLHMPHSLAGISAVRRHRPDLPQVACFDTAFHARLPNVARMTGLPADIAGHEIRRYGFHGLSYEYILQEMRHAHGSAVDKRRLIVAHLGSGASMAAIQDGHSVETTMGFSTLAGLPMGTRSGDLDPGVVLYLMLEKQMSADAVQHMLYERCGLLGISGVSADMQQLLARMDREEIAAAVEYFCYRARTSIGTLAAALGGLDVLVFTGGIGANAPEVRRRICEGLGFLGIALEPEKNRAGERTISRQTSRVAVEALPTDEELMIAQHTIAILQSRGMRRTR